MTLTLLLVVVLLIVTGAFVWVLSRSRGTADLLLKQEIDHLKQNVNSSSKLVHQQLSQLTKEVGDRLQESMKLMQEANRHVGDRLDNAARVVGEVQNRLGKVEESTLKVFEVGRDIAKLQEILRAPKLRGSLGELFLGDLLAQVLPKERFELQFTFKSGEKVDAVIRSAQGLIAIDSKFPLENFVKILETKGDEERRGARRLFLQDVKKHIDAIAQKYILPDEGTLDFALMYIPAENVYYEIVLKNEGNERDLLRYAQERHVFPVSPNSFYAYLQTIAVGLKGMQLAEGVREVLDDVARLRREFGKFGEEFAKVGTHLSHARGSFEAADKRFQRLGEKLETLGVEGGPQELRVLKGGEEGG
jgi:DNA recombination protein RmuC